MICWLVLQVHEHLNTYLFERARVRIPQLSLDFFTFWAEGRGREGRRRGGKGGIRSSSINRQLNALISGTSFLGLRFRASKRMHPYLSLSTNFPKKVLFVVETSRCRDVDLNSIIQYRTLCTYLLRLIHRYVTNVLSRSSHLCR